MLIDLLDFLEIESNKLLNQTMFCDGCTYEIKIKMQEINDLIDKLSEFENCYNELKIT